MILFEMDDFTQNKPIKHHADHNEKKQDDKFA